jgi:hypothetical protein
MWTAVVATKGASITKADPLKIRKRRGRSMRIKNAIDPVSTARTGSTN